MAYKRELIAKTKNLFDKSKAIKGKTIRYTDGGEYDDAPYYASDYINVSGISTLTITPTYETPSVCFYDKNKTFISSTRTMIGVSVPSNAVYIRFDNKLTNLGTCQLEKGTTATDYVPYGYLPSYKKLLKVSDVCQLLDKRNFGTRSSGGTTATYNNDGTFTVSGTATANSWKNFPVFQLLPGGGEHVYLFNVVGISNDINCYCNIYFYDEITDRAVELMQTGWEGSAVIKKLETPTVYQARFNITTLTGATPNNIVYKPQLFDLTEMYGAGNEPATVDEFKAKFPNDLYDYSPRCWVTSYKTGLIAKTKNLFDVNALTPYTPETLPRGMAGVYNGNIISKGNPHDTVASTGKTLRELCPDLIVGETYILTFETNVPPSIGGQYESIVLMGVGNWWRTITRTITDADLSAIVGIYADTDGSTYKTWNFQIEKGSTATDYVPYGYL